MDGLSRLPQTVDQDQVVVLLQNSVWAVQASLDKLPVTAKDIQTASRNDPVLSKVLRYITTGWGSSADNDELKPFFYRQQELTIEQGCIMWGSQGNYSTSVSAPSFTGTPQKSSG